MWAAEAIFCVLYKWPTLSAWPADSDNNPADALLQVAHNNEGTPRIRRSQLLHPTTECYGVKQHVMLPFDMVK